MRLYKFLLSPLKRERSWRNTVAWTKSTRSGSRTSHVDLVACALAVRVVGNVKLEGGDAEAAARSRRAMGRCTRGAGVVANVCLGKCPILLPPHRRAGEIHQLGPRPPEAVLVVFSLRFILFLRETYGLTTSLRTGPEARSGLGIRSFFFCQVKKNSRGNRQDSLSGFSALFFLLF